MPFKDTLVVNLTALELMGHVAIPYTGKEFLCYIEDAHLMPLQYSNQGSSLEVARAEKEDRLFFTPLNPFGYNPDEEEPSDDLSKPRKVHYYSKWKNTQDAVYWVNFAGEQDKGLRFWQTV